MKTNELTNEEFELIESRSRVLQAELQQVYEESSPLRWDKDREKIKELEKRADEIRNEMYDTVARLKDSPVIRLLEKFSDEGISPVPALDYWISSWC